jgi:hypothetical protein
LTAGGQGAYMQNDEVFISINENTVLTHLTYVLTQVIQLLANKIEQNRNLFTLNVVNQQVRTYQMCPIIY